MSDEVNAGNGPFNPISAGIMSEVFACVQAKTRQANEARDMAISAKLFAHLTGINRNIDIYVTVSMVLDIMLNGGDKSAQKISEMLIKEIHERFEDVRADTIQNVEDALDALKPEDTFGK